MISLLSTKRTLYRYAPFYLYRPAKFVEIGREFRCININVFIIDPQTVIPKTPLCSCIRIVFNSKSSAFWASFHRISITLLPIILVISKISRFYYFLNNDTLSFKKQRSPGRGYGLELVSRPFYMDKLDTFLKPIADNVQNLEVNSSCGMHVHVDLEIGYDNPLAKRTIINLTKIIYNNQSVIYRLLPTSRRTNQFCRQLRYEEISDLIRTRTPLKTFSSIYKNEHSKRQLKDKAYTYETSKDRQSNNWRKTYHRYHSINLTPLLDIGTIEFRMFDSTLDIEKIKFYIKLVEGISKYAIRSKKVRLFRGTKITNSYKNNRKRLWEFLRALEMTEYYQYCKKLMDEVR